MNRQATIGLTVWLVLLSLLPLTPGIGTVERYFLFAPLVVVPLGFALLARWNPPAEKWTALDRASQFQAPAAFLVIASFLLESNLGAALLTIPWFATGAFAALHGVAYLRRRGARFESLVVFSASAYLFIGASWLFASRAGWNPAGFQEPIVLLTAVHFHYSGFAAVLITGTLAARCAQDSRLMLPARVVCIGTILAMPLISAGFVLSLPFKVVSVFFLALCLGGAALLTLWISHDLRVHAARMRLRFSSGAVLAGMALAALYAAGEYTRNPVIDLHEMAIAHGTLNALGFSFCGLWGWNLVSAKEAIWLHR